MPESDIIGAQPSVPPDLLTQAPTIETLRRRFDAARQDGNRERVNAQRNRDYYDGPKQLTPEVRETLRTRGQPPIYTNRIRPAVNGVLGVLEASERDPQAYPRNPGDQDAADVCTKTLRFIADQSNFAETKMDVAENFLIEGTGAVIIELDADRIVATQIRWEEFYADPYSRRPDFRDARYMGVAKWMDADQVRQQWKVRIGDIGDPLAPQGAGFLDDSWQDRPQSQGWVDVRRRRVMVVEEYAIEQGQWMRCVYIASGVLEYDVSPYLDEKRRPSCPIEAVSCYVNRENGRYGFVSDMIPIQDEINASRSRSLHLMNSRQVQQTDPAAPPVDSVTVRQEAAKADGVIPTGWQIVQHSDVTQANMARMQEAKSEIERMGPTPAVLGRSDGANESGRARQVMQQAGLTELARPLARFTDWELRCYRQMWARARQFWTAPMFVRVTDDVRSPDFLRINEPVLGMVAQPVAGPDGQPMLDPHTGQPAMRPAVGQVGTRNRIAEMDLDIIIDSVPDNVNLAGEIWSDLVKLVAEAGGLPAVFSPAFELMIEMSPLPAKRDIIEKLQNKQKEQAQATAAQAQAQQQAAAEAHQLQVADASATIQEKQSRATLNLAKAHADAARPPVEAARTDLIAAQAAKAAADAERARADAAHGWLGVISPRDDVE